MGVAVDLAGQVFVADSDADRVVVLSLEGKKLNTRGTSGRAPGKFRTPMALDVGIDGHIYILDQGNNRVQVFQTDGSFISSWRIAARGYDRLENSTGIAVLDDGSVLLTNFFSNRLYRCSSDGSLIGWVGGRPHEPHLVNMPCGIGTAADGTIYVADGAVKVFSPLLELLDTWP
jgi:DNA-binding beta-propeller fold protein YncE